MIRMPARLYSLLDPHRNRRNEPANRAAFHGQGSELSYPGPEVTRLGLQLTGRGATDSRASSRKASAGAGSSTILIERIYGTLGLGVCLIGLGLGVIRILV